MAREMNTLYPACPECLRAIDRRNPRYECGCVSCMDLSVCVECECVIDATSGTVCDACASAETEMMDEAAVAAELAALEADYADRGPEASREQILALVESLRASIAETATVSERPSSKSGKEAA